MKTLFKNILPLFMLSLVLLCGASEANAQDQSIMVIASTQGVPSSMSMTELKSIMQGEKQRWSDGTKVSIAFMKANTAVGNATAKKVLGMSGDQLNKLWLALVFQGKAKAPVFYASSSDVESYIQQNPGAIGFVEAGYVPKSCHTVIIDGKKTF